MTDQSPDEIAWRAKRMLELTVNAGIAPEPALNIIALEAKWSPWVSIVVKFPVLRNFRRFERC